MTLWGSGVNFVTYIFSSLKCGEKRCLVFAPFSFTCIFSLFGISFDLHSFFTIHHHHSIHFQTFREKAKGQTQKRFDELEQNIYINKNINIPADNDCLLCFVLLLDVQSLSIYSIFFSHFSYTIVLWCCCWVVSKKSSSFLLIGMCLVFHVTPVSILSIMLLFRAVFFLDFARETTIHSFRCQSCLQTVNLLRSTVRETRMKRH